MPKLTKLSVLTNPWHAIDHKGRPCCAVRQELTSSVIPKVPVFIGAKLNPPILDPDVQGNRASEHEGNRQAVLYRSFTFSPNAITVPATKYYKRAVKDGALLAADLDTALECGVSKEEYEAPEDIRASEKSKALAQFKATYGIDAPECDPYQPLAKKEAE